jgi:hypothetical protein
VIDCLEKQSTQFLYPYQALSLFYIPFIHYN